jgi:hypothetical protein
MESGKRNRESQDHVDHYRKVAKLNSNLNSLRLRPPQVVRNIQNIEKKENNT